MPPIASANVTTPGQSLARGAPSRGAPFGAAHRVSPIVIAASGTLTSRTARQSMNSVRRPPSTGPSAAKKADAPAISPSARPRFSGGKVAVTMAIVVGIISAAPTPWVTRIVMSQGMFWAAPASADEATNTIAPVRKTLRRPS